MSSAPERTCIACRRKDAQDAFLRVGRTSDERIVIGAGGRSAYVCSSVECIENALQKDRLSRALRCAVSQDAKDWVREELVCRLR